MDRNEFYKVLGLPKGASKEAATKMYNLLKDKYSALIKEGKLEPEKLNELNMAYFFVTMDNTEEVIKKTIDNFVQENNIIQKLLNIVALLGVFASECSLEFLGTYSQNIDGIMLNYGERLNKYIEDIKKVKDVDKLLEMIKDYSKIEAEFMHEFSRNGKYYNYCTNLMIYGILNTRDFLQFNADLSKCHNSNEIIEFLKNNIGFVMKISHADAEMKDIFFTPSLLNLSVSERDSVMKRTAAVVISKTVQNKFSLKELLDFYRSGQVAKIRNDAISSVNSGPKLDKKL